MTIAAGRIGMAEAVRYIADQSVWVRRHQNDEAWITELENDLSDALRLGWIKAYGRDKTHEIYRYPARRIARAEWDKVVPDILDYRGQPCAANARKRGGRGHVIYDLHLRRRDIERLWPRLGFLDRHRLTSPWAEYTSARSEYRDRNRGRRSRPSFLAQLRRTLTSALQRKRK